MPRTQRQKSRGGAFVVSPWMGKEEYSGVSASARDEEEACYRVVECSSLLVGSQEHHPDEGECHPSDMMDEAPLSQNEDRYAIVDDSHSRREYFRPPTVDGEQCVMCVTYDGRLRARVAGGHALGISGKVFDVSDIDCSMDSASRAVVLRLFSTDSACSAVYPVWVLAGSSGGDAMCLKSPMADLVDQDVLGSLVFDGKVDLELEFRCHTIINCDVMETSCCSAVESQLLDAIQDEDIVTWVVDEMTTLSHVNIGTLTLSGSTNT